MILHNIKIAFRNLLKYKLQNVISILSIAIGIVAISAVHSFLSNVHEPRICDEPYFDRTFKVTLFGEGENKYFNPLDLEGMETIDGNVIAEYSYVSASELKITFNGKKYKSNQSIYLIAPNGLNFFGIRSAVTGNRIAPIKEGEALISERFAKTFFGDINPIGSRLEWDGGDAIIVDVCEFNPFLNNDPRIAPIMISVKSSQAFPYIDPENYHKSVSTAYLVMKEGVEYETFAHEIALRLGKQRGEVWVDQICNNGQNSYFQLTSTLYIIGYMILLASIIGFLRMQIQLFWMRKRELALRVVNGAKRHQLFGMMITETAITIIISAVISAILGVMLKNSAFIDRLEEQAQLNVLTNQGFYCILVCLGLIMACGAIIYIVVNKICNSNNGLSAIIRKSNSHIFRNIMLGIQTFICMALLSITIPMTYNVFAITEDSNIPKDTRIYHDALSISSQRNEALYEEISKLTETKMIFKERCIYLNEAEIGLDTTDSQRHYFMVMHLPDTSAVDFMAIDADYKRDECISNQSCIINQEFYERCKNEGVISDGTIILGQDFRYDEQQQGWMPNGMITLKITGTFKAIAYNNYYDPVQIIVVGEPGNPLNGYGERWIALAYPGQKDCLAQSIKTLIENVDPMLDDDIVEGITDRFDEREKFKNSTLTGLWILGITSLILCISGIYSTAALDTRARRKEMAIRKINGAKAKDIAMLFVKSYIWILIPAILLSSLIAFVTMEAIDEETKSTAMLLVGIGISIVSIVLTLAHHIRQIMQVNPSEIIAKE